MGNNEVSFSPLNIAEILFSQFHSHQNNQYVTYNRHWHTLCYVQEGKKDQG